MLKRYEAARSCAAAHYESHDASTGGSCAPRSAHGGARQELGAHHVLVPWRDVGLDAGLQRFTHAAQLVAVHGRAPHASTGGGGRGGGVLVLLRASAPCG